MIAHNVCNGFLLKTIFPGVGTTPSLLLYCSKIIKRTLNQPNQRNKKSTPLICYHQLCTLPCWISLETLFSWQLLLVTRPWLSSMPLNTKKRKNNAAFEPSAIVLKHVINKTKFYRLEPRASQIQECNSTSLDSNPWKHLQIHQYFSSKYTKT